MAEPRDRLIRLDPLTPISAQRSIRGAAFWRDFHLSPSRFSNGGGQNLFRSQLPWRAAGATGPTDPAMATSPGFLMGRAHYYGTPRLGNGRGRYGLVGLENLGTAGSGRHRRRRGRSSVLPSWYPRTPLQDITGVVNAIERRSRLREAERHRIASPSSQELSIFYPPLFIAGAPLEHSTSHTTPKPMVVAKTFSSPAGRISEILLGNHTVVQSDFLTPQKKLLNSIDQVEKVVMEDFRRMRRTPSAKKAERQKKVRTLMAMR